MTESKGIVKKEKCFVIMPISDPEGYETGHFKCVYEDILRPAIEAAGYEAFRVDEQKSSNLIQVSIIEEIINAPMAVCDLSTRNPNVLFELGIRQAFDLPVVLVQEEGTKRIFDISNINTIDYRSKLIYREVIDDRTKIKEGIESTRDSKNGINSIIKLLQVGKKAELNNDTMTENQELKFMMMSLANEVSQVNNSLRRMKREENEKYIIKNNSIAQEMEDDIIEKLKKMRNRVAHGRKYTVREVSNETGMSMGVMIDILQSCKKNTITPTYLLSNEDFIVLIEYWESNRILLEY